MKNLKMKKFYAKLIYVGVSDSQLIFTRFNIVVNGNNVKKTKSIFTHKNNKRRN